MSQRTILLTWGGVLFLFGGLAFGSMPATITVWFAMYDAKHNGAHKGGQKYIYQAYAAIGSQHSVRAPVPPG